MGVTSPPESEKRIILGTPPAIPEKRMSPFRFQAPGPTKLVSAKVRGEPPVTSTFFSLPVEKNASQRPSGDQNRLFKGLSVPCNRWAVMAPIGRTQIALCPF